MSKSIKTEIIIDASKETVWKHLTGFEAYGNWNPFILGIEGELREGARLRNTLKSGKGTMVFKPLVTEMVPFQKFAWLGSLFIKGIFDGRHYFIIEELGPAQVKLVHGEIFSGLLSGMILNRIGDDTRNNFVAMNMALKKLCEADAAQQS